MIPQISDPHVRPIGQLYKGLIDTNRVLTDAVDHLNALEPRPELVLISGDLVDEGHPDEYAAVRIILSRLQIPYWVIPGNHDQRGAFGRAYSDHSYLPIGGGSLHYTISWLRVSGTTEMPQIDQCVGHQFHTVVPLLFELEAQQQPLEFIFPRKGPFHA